MEATCWMLHDSLNVMCEISKLTKWIWLTLPFSHANLFLTSFTNFVFQKHFFYPQINLKVAKERSKHKNHKCNFFEFIEQKKWINEVKGWCSVCVCKCVCVCAEKGRRKTDFSCNLLFNRKHMLQIRWLFCCAEDTLLHTHLLSNFRTYATKCSIVFVFITCE